MATVKRTPFERILWMNGWVSNTMLICGFLGLLIGPFTAFVPPVTAILVGALRFIVKPKMGKFFVPAGLVVGLVELILSPFLHLPPTGHFIGDVLGAMLALVGGCMLVVSVVRMLMVNSVTFSQKARSEYAASTKTQATASETDEI